MPFLLEEESKAHDKTIQQEKSTTQKSLKPPHKEGIKLRIATLNVNGMKSTAKREEIENWMIRNSVDILILQETPHRAQPKGTEKIFPMVFSGATKDNQANTWNGVAIVST